jgi:hypothetical protein
MKLPAAAALACLVTIGGLTSLPILAIGVGGSSPPGCGEIGEVADDGTPSILGPSALTVSDLRAWWNSTGRGQPARLGIAIEDLIALYVSEGDAEGVRGDMALAQAVLETGHFTNSDTAINNFAGIAHYDGAASGSAFADPIIGVRAQIQLLKKYAWATTPRWPTRTSHPGPARQRRRGVGSPGPGPRPRRTGLRSAPCTSRCSLTLARRPPRPTPFDSGSTRSRAQVGTSPSAATTPCRSNGTGTTRTRAGSPSPTTTTPQPTSLSRLARPCSLSPTASCRHPDQRKCGIGVIFNGDDGAQYTYCHGNPGTQAVAIGDRVSVGQHILDSASTGNSTGPHLHFGIRVDGTQRCPQPFFVAIADGAPLAPRGLPTSGCSY